MLRPCLLFLIWMNVSIFLFLVTLLIFNLFMKNWMFCSICEILTITSQLHHCQIKCWFYCWDICESRKKGKVGFFFSQILFLMKHLYMQTGLIFLAISLIFLAIVLNNCFILWKSQLHILMFESGRSEQDECKETMRGFIWLKTWEQPIS